MADSEKRVKPFYDFAVSEHDIHEGVLGGMLSKKIYHDFDQWHQPKSKQGHERSDRRPLSSDGLLAH